MEEKKQTVMETITIEYDKNNKAARSMVSALKQFDFLKVKKQCCIQLTNATLVKH